MDLQLVAKPRLTMGLFGGLLSRVAARSIKRLRGAAAVGGGREHKIKVEGRDEKGEKKKQGGEIDESRHSTRQGKCRERKRESREWVTSGARDERVDGGEEGKRVRRG